MWIIVYVRALSHGTDADADADAEAGQVQRFNIDSNGGLSHETG